MSAPLTKSQMAFELPKLSYIDTRWEEPAVPATIEPVRPHKIADWIADRIDAFRIWRMNSKALTELANMSDRELYDVGLSRGDLDRVFDDRFNRDLRFRTR